MTHTRSTRRCSRRATCPRSARDDLVATLDRVADGMDGQLGDLIRSGADQLGGMTDLQAPETVEAIERLHDGLSSFCG